MEAFWGAVVGGLISILTGRTWWSGAASADRRPSGPQLLSNSDSRCSGRTNSAAWSVSSRRRGGVDRSYSGAQPHDSGLT
jgi:hypothetical protein